MKKLMLRVNTIKRNRANDLIGILLLFQPLLNSYAVVGIPGSLSDISIVIIAGIWLFWISPKKGLRIEKSMLFFIPFLMYIVLNCIITMILHNENIFTEYLRMVVKYFLLITLILPDITLDYWIKKWFSVFSFLLTVYCAMQYIAINFLGVFLPSYIPFLKFREDLQNESDYLNYAWFYRPHSIFQEPAHFCEFILVYLALLVFDGKPNFKNYALRIFVSAVILLTGSLTGVVGVAMLWGISVVTGIKQKISEKTLVSFIMIMPMALVVVVGIILKSTSFNVLLQRVFSSGSAVESRFGNVEDMFSLNWNIIHSIFGFGYRYGYFADKVGWLSSYFMFLLYFGVIGIFLFAVALIKMYVNMPKSKLSKSLFILFIVLNTATEMFFDMYLIMYLFVIFCSKEKVVYDGLSQSEYYNTSIQKGTLR